MNELREAEQTEFPPVLDDEVWCPVRGQIVGATTCATDACVAPEMRVACWQGKIARDPEIEES